MRFGLSLVGLAFIVMPVLGQDDIRGPKPLVEIPLPEPQVPWERNVLVGLLVLLLLGGLFAWWKSRKPAVASAEEKARRALVKLERDGDTLEAGDFAAGASQVVRVFIERRFGLAAPRRTTEEFLHELAGDEGKVLQSRSTSLKDFLKSCDMAKFAAAELEFGERGELVAKARAFIAEPKEGEEG